MKKRSSIKSKFIDKVGNKLPRNSVRNNPLKKKAFGQFSSILEWPNQDRYRSRFYINQDTETGASYLTRDLLLRWSREMVSQQPWIQVGIRTLAEHAVGCEYLPEYIGNNSAWGKIATDWLIQVFYPNCCKRGKNFDFQTVVFLISMMMDQDGDFLRILGEDKEGPKFQIIPSHRISSLGSRNSYDVVFPTAQNEGPVVGPIPGTIISDGVVFTMDGTPVGHMVLNPKNLVNSMAGGNQGSMFFSIDNAKLIYDPRFWDRGRGFPSISSGILQALSLSEIESYWMDKIKVQSLIALEEKTPTGEGPIEEAEAAQRMLESSDMLDGSNVNKSTANKGLRIVTNPSIRYVSSNGGSIKSLAGSVADSETMDYMTRLETHVLGTIGVPHALIFSPDDVAGKANETQVSIFNGSISHRQGILDKEAKFIIGWALSKAVENGELPPNDEEIYGEVFNLSHPPKFSINSVKDKQMDIEEMDAGIKSRRDVLKKYNKTPEQVDKEIEEEQIRFFNSANRIAKETSTDVSVVIQSMKESLKQKTATQNEPN